MHGNKVRRGRSIQGLPTEEVATDGQGTQFTSSGSSVDVPTIRPTMREADRELLNNSRDSDDILIDDAEVPVTTTGRDEESLDAVLDSLFDEDMEALLEDLAKTVESSRSREAVLLRSKGSDVSGAETAGPGLGNPLEAASTSSVGPCAPETTSRSSVQPRVTEVASTSSEWSRASEAAMDNSVQPCAKENTTTSPLRSSATEAETPSSEGPSLKETVTPRSGTSGVAEAAAHPVQARSAQPVLLGGGNFGPERVYRTEPDTTRKSRSTESAQPYPRGAAASLSKTRTLNMRGPQNNYRPTGFDTGTNNRTMYEDPSNSTGPAPMKPSMGNDPIGTARSERGPGTTREAPSQCFNCYDHTTWPSGLRKMVEDLRYRAACKGVNRRHAVIHIEDRIRYRVTIKKNGDVFVTKLGRQSESRAPQGKT